MRNPIDWVLSLGAIWIVVWFLLVILTGIGWIMNIIHILHMDVFMTALGIVRIAGIFVPPLGGFMGWFF
jgi:hypothetical protein